MDKKASNKRMKAPNSSEGMRGVLTKVAEKSPHAAAVIAIGVSAITAVGSEATVYPTLVFALLCLVIYVWLVKQHLA
jgi:hypothetical protein